jgi:CubicO group peptidase (beta-lactamase class C family)
MRKITSWLLLPALMACSAHQLTTGKVNSNNAAPETSQGPADAAEFGSFIDSLISTQLKKENIPGAAFVFVKDGKIFFMKGYGLSNIEKNTVVDPLKTIFRIGSVSKVFTADAILQLADKKKIDLNRDVNTYLTGLKVPSTFPGPITANHILTHTTGLDEIRPGTQGPDAASVQPLNVFLSNKMIRLWPPGEIVMYSTYGITLGGLLVESVTGEKFEAYLAGNIWKPLQMHRTNITVPGELKPDVAIGYENSNGVNTAQDWEWYHTTPASSVNSTAEDMAHWMIAHLNQGQYASNRVISAKMMNEMLRHHQGMNPGMYGIAYGFFEEYYNGLRFLYHGGNMAGFNSQVVLIPTMNAGFFFVSQHEGSSIRDNIQWAILEKYYQNPGIRKGPVVNGSAVQRANLFAGRYRYNVYCHSCERQAKTMVFNVSANGDGTIQLNSRRWIESEEKLLFIREDGKARIAFRADSSGQVTHMYFGGSWSFEKIK